MKLGIPVYEGVDLLDVMGPFEMFGWVDKAKGLEVVLLSEDGEAVTSGNGVRFEVHGCFDDALCLDVLWVPGGVLEALQRMLPHAHSAYFEYLRHVSKDATWVCSVCEGALLLARAGLLKGHFATTHWAFVNCLAQFEGVIVDREHRRFVQSGNRFTCGGISAGLDGALELIRLLFDEETAEDVQATTQYFPKPPVEGELGKTPACMLHW
jgi:cyclohexyl-isocyanide hydratase